MYSLAKGGFHAVLHLLHLAQHQGRAADLPRGDHAAAGDRLLSARTSGRIRRTFSTSAAGGRPAGVYAARHPGGDADVELRHLRARVRAWREHAAMQARERGVPGQREIRDPAVGPRSPHSIAPLIATLNQIRASNPALQRNERCTSITSITRTCSATRKTLRGPQQYHPGRDQPRPTQEQAGWIDLDLRQLGIP